MYYFFEVSLFFYLYFNLCPTSLALLSSYLVIEYYTNAFFCLFICSVLHIQYVMGNSPMFLLPDVAVAWDQFIYHHYPILLFVNPLLLFVNQLAFSQSEYGRILIWFCTKWTCT